MPVSASNPRKMTQTGVCSPICANADGSKTIPNPEISPQRRRFIPRLQIFLKLALSILGMTGGAAGLLTIVYQTLGQWVFWGIISFLVLEIFKAMWRFAGELVDDEESGPRL